MIWFKGNRDHLLHFLPKGGVGAEVGTRKGRFAYKMCKVLTPKKLTLIDPWRQQPADEYPEIINTEDAEQEGFYQEVLKHFSDLIAAGTVEIMRELSSTALPKLPDNSLDWIYIDGNHRFACVLSDLTQAYRIVKDDGLIMGHDWDELCSYGVIAAGLTFLRTHPELELSVITRDIHWPPSFIIARRDVSAALQQRIVEAGWAI